MKVEPQSFPISRFLSLSNCSVEQEEKPAITLAHTELDVLRLWGHQLGRWMYMARARGRGAGEINVWGTSSRKGYFTP